MPVEIERKFLVVHDGWRRHATHHDVLRDGLVAFEADRKVRVRTYNGTRATLCVKSPRHGLGRMEFEYEIPVADAADLFASCSDRILEKARYYVPNEGHIWEVDVYRGLLAGVTIAEIELPTEATKPALPDWVGREVTGDPSYRKITMLSERLKALAPRAGSSRTCSGTPA